MFLVTRFSRHFLRNSRKYYTVNSNVANVQHDLIAQQLYKQIKITGPITIADYMKYVLTHPLGGYYMKKDVFGQEGDFITSPELGQIFGEMIAVWLINEWSKIGAPKPFQIVELGPGRGTLCQDVLRVFKHFNALKEVSVHLVEISELMSDLQSRRLCVRSDIKANNESDFYREGISFDNVPIRWYKHLKVVPNAFTLLIAHEFFDALPIHKFQRFGEEYREILIDIDVKRENTFRYVAAKQETPASKLFIKNDEQREHLEVSTDSLVCVKDIALRLEEYGGVALIADYGHDGDGTDTFRAFKKHQLHDPLVEPGTADLTADVDFARLKEAAIEEDRVLAFGPVTQRDFLLRMGIEHRLRVLEEGVNDEQKTLLRSSYNTMIDADKMGTRFKFMALLPSVLEKILKKVPVAGFQ